MDLQGIGCLDCCSEGVLIFSWEPVAVLTPVIGDNTDHLIKLWPDLHAASQPAILSVGLGGPLEAPRLCAWHFIKSIEEGVWYHHLALSARDTHAVVVIWNLMRGKSVLGLSTLAISEHTWGHISSENVQETFSLEGGVSPWDTIWWKYINPDTKTSKLK